ncbi:CsgG/HfaB family protein [Anaerovibrio sp.]|uniref:CsgG/HfaB family protein n=1 Tax=Anaerovibrio sp. TaxID=1872532 RepID=UPI00388E810A
MRKLICLLLMLGLLGTGTGYCASLQDYPNIAVLPYANKAAVSKQLSLADASLVSEFVIEQLLDSERFNVIEREMLEAIMKEHSFNMSGMVDPLTAVQIGKLAGVKYLVAGSVTGLSTKSSGASYSDTRVGGGGFNINTVIANVSARFIDVETGRIVLAASGTGESASTNMEFKLRSTKQETASDGYDYAYNDVGTYTNDGYIDDVSGDIGTDTEMVDSDTEAYPDDAEMTESQELPVADNYVQDNMSVSMPATTDTTRTVVTRERKIVIGTKSFSQVQVRNALYKAVGDLIYNKNFGLLAKMDGKGKRRKV